MHYLTIQGDRLRKGDFTIQEFLGFRFNAGQVSDREVLIAPKGAPSLANFSHVSLADLLANLGFWRVVKTEYAASPATPVQEGRLMVEMARARAVQGIVNQRTFVDILPSDAMQSLLNDQRACEVTGVPGHYQLSAKGLGCLILQQKISPCGNAFTFERGCADSFKDKTKWELMIHLAQAGWRDEEVSGKADSYVLGAAKVYYTRPYGNRMPHPYLVCLCLADELLDKGCAGLVHFQSNAYYNMLQFLLESHPHLLGNLLPNQCRQYYLDFKHRVEHGTLRQSRGRGAQQGRSNMPGSAQLHPMLEEDNGFDGVQSQPSDTVSRARGRGRGSGRSSRGNASAGLKRAHLASMVDSDSDAGAAGAEADVVDVASMEAVSADLAEPDQKAAELEQPSVEVMPTTEEAAASSHVGGGSSSSRAARAHVAPRLPRTPLAPPPERDRTLVLSETTIFFGDIAIVKRTDQGVSWLQHM